MDENGHVLVIGATNLDVKGRPDGALAQGSSAPGTIRNSHGGVARNIAENLARLEVETVLLTAVGSDEAGEQILGHAAASGIDVSEALVIGDQRTGTYMAILNAEGSLDFGLDDMAIMSCLTPDYFTARAPLFEQARMVVIDANLPPESIDAVVKLCQRTQTPLCADPTSTALASRLAPHLTHLHLICPNHHEAEVLLGQRFDPASEEAARAAAAGLVSQGVKIAVITLGEFGVVYADAETTGHIPAIAGQIVDLTGAGDAMTAAILFGLLENVPLDESVRLGVTAATLTMRTRETVRPDLSVDLLYDELVI